MKDIKKLYAEKSNSKDQIELTQISIDILKEIEKDLALESQSKLTPNDTRFRVCNIIEKVIMLHMVLRYKF